MGIYARHDGEWYSVGEGGKVGGAGAAVISGHNGATVENGKVIDGKTYDVYTFTTATTRASMRLTDEARARTTDEDLLMAIATMQLPPGFTGDPVELFDSRYRDLLRNVLEIAPAADPGLTLNVSKAGMVDALIVGGGGGGGKDAGGGGGAGDFIRMSFELPDGPHSVVVGSGGTGQTVSANANGASGSPSSLSFVRAIGGGGGGSGSSNGGGDGGSGGGASGVSGRGGPGGKGLGFQYKNNGGDASPHPTSATASGGGGAGAGTEGHSNVIGPPSGGGNGGAGRSASDFGVNSDLAGGGGGGSGGSSAYPGIGFAGAGNGAADLHGVTGSNAAPNTGSGGGGGSGGQGNGGDGGSGIVIVRVEV